MEQNYSHLHKNSYNYDMKFVIALSVALFPFMACAQNATPLKPVPPDTIQIIDGKKFFSLKNVRRHEGTGYSPSALAVMNHPRMETRIPPAPLPSNHRMAMTPPSSNVAPTPPSIKNDLLSVFAPDEAINTHPSANSAFPSAK